MHCSTTATRNVRTRNNASSSSGAVFRRACQPYAANSAREATAIATKVLATLFVVYPFGLIAPISWTAVGIIWLYCLFWALIEDRAKLAVYAHLAHSAPRHRDFLGLLKRRAIHPRHQA